MKHLRSPRPCELPKPGARYTSKASGQSLCDPLGYKQHDPACPIQTERRRLALSGGIHLWAEEDEVFATYAVRNILLSPNLRGALLVRLKPALPRKGKVGALARTDTGSVWCLLQLAEEPGTWVAGLGWLLLLASILLFVASIILLLLVGVAFLLLSRSTATHHWLRAAADQRYRSGRSGSAGLAAGL